MIRLLALVIFVGALEAQALTLGRMRGAAIIGQGLDVSIQLQADPEEGPAGLCLEADVFHADARQDGSRVQVNVEPTATPQAFTVRVRSSATIDEPVVTVYLRAGCTQKISRRYVMLAEVLSDPAPPILQQVPLVVPGPAAAMPVPSAGTSVPAAATGSVPALAPSTGGASPDAVRPAVRPARPRTTPRPTPKPVAPAAPRKAVPAQSAAGSAPAAAPPVAEKQAAGRVGGQSRLKLDPLEVLSERVATLESSTASAPAEQAAREARDAQRLQSLEASVKNLLELATRNEANLVELRSRLQQAEADRYTNPLVYGLAALLLLSLATLAYLLGRRGSAASASGGNWWTGASQAQHPEGRAGLSSGGATRPSGFSPVSTPAPLSGPGAMTEAEATQLQTQRGGPASRPAPITQVDVSLVEMSESTFDRLMQSGATHSAVRRPQAPEPTTPAPAESPARRLVNSDELFDIRQQAEFFVSLGQTDQAVRILENRISESGESSPLAYLDLLKIFHSLGLKADFRQLCEDFSLLFNARVPEFANFGNEGRDLEAYPELVDSLVKAWGRPEVLPLIEAQVFRDQVTGERELLDLAVFRDLLLLHAIAQTAALLPNEMVTAADRKLPRSPFSAVRPVAAPASATAFDLDLDVGDVPRLPETPADTADFQSSGVDIDLSDITMELPAIEGLPGGAPAPASANQDSGNLIEFDLPILPGQDDKEPKAAG